VGPRAGLDGRNISSSLGFDAGPSSPAAQLLYRLSNRAHKLTRVVTFNTRVVINIQKSLRKASVFFFDCCFCPVVTTIGMSLEI